MFPLTSDLKVLRWLQSLVLQHLGLQVPPLSLLTSGSLEGMDWWPGGQSQMFPCPGVEEVLGHQKSWLKKPWSNDIIVSSHCPLLLPWQLDGGPRPRRSSCPSGPSGGMHPLQRRNSGASLAVLLVMVEFSFTDGSGAAAKRPNSRWLLVSCNKESSTVFREKA